MEAAKIFFYRSSWAAGILMNPQVGLLIVLLLLRSRLGPLGNFELRIVALGLISLALFLLTNTKYLRFLGTAERYIEFYVPFLSILNGYYLIKCWNFNLPKIIIPLATYALILTVATWIAYLKNAQKRIEQYGEMLEIINWLNITYPSGSNVYPPPDSLTYMIPYLTRCSCPIFLGSPEKDLSTRDLEIIYNSKFEDRVQSLDYLSHKYQLELIIIHQKHASLLQQKAKNIKQIFSTSEYMIYRT